MRTPKDANYAAQAILELRNGNPNARARLTMAKLAVTAGNYTQEGRAEWQRYVDQGAPR